jgi:chloramphenicol-sensitive protein RarD
MVLIGCVLHKEKLSRWQLVAVILAALGVGHEIWRIGGVAWETAYVALAYPLYFYLRRLFKTDHLGGFWWDLLLILPVAFYLLSTSESLSLIAQYPYLIWVIIGLGFLSALGLGSYILASRYLPFVLFGLLSYLEPVLLAAASIALGEQVKPDEWLTYIPIWCAVLVLVVEGSVHLYKQQRLKQNLARNIEKAEECLNDQD